MKKIIASVVSALSLMLGALPLTVSAQSSMVSNPATGEESVWFIFAGVGLLAIAVIVISIVMSRKKK